MHDIEFADAVWQVPARILRLNLRPYSIGHEIILLNKRNAIIGDRKHFDEIPETLQRQCLIRAVLTCYRTWRENHLEEKNLWLWSLMNRGTDWSLSIAEFRNYHEAGTARPPSPTKDNYEMAAGLQNEDEGRELGGSMMSKMLMYAASMPYKDLGYETPYDVPMCILNFCYLSAQEEKGNIVIENHREKKVRLEMEGYAVEIAKEKEAQKCLP